MTSRPTQIRIEARLRKMENAIKEIFELIDNPMDGTLNVNLFILKTCKDDIKNASFHVKEALRMLGHWEAKRGGRPVGFIPDRNKRGRYG